MIRRTFIKYGLGAIGLPMLGISSKVDPDPFIDVVLKKGQFAVVGNKRFRQTVSGNCAILTREDGFTFTNYIPLDKTNEQESASEFVERCEKEYNGYKVDYYRIFNEDKTRSNLYAECYFEVVNGSN